MAAEGEPGAAGVGGGGGVGRIASLVPSMTETVCRLGGAGSLVGITRYCNYPVAPLQGVPEIGGTKNPKREAVARLDPELVLCNAEENREEDIGWFRERFNVLECTPRTVADAEDVLRRVGSALGAEEELAAELLALETAVTRAAVERSAGARRGQGRLRVFYPIWHKPWMSINDDTYIHDVLRVCGALNVCGGFDARYPQVDLEEIAALGVDAVLLPDEPHPFEEGEARALRASGVFGDAPVVRVVGRGYCWHGGYTATGIHEVLEDLAPLRSRAEG